MLKKYLTKSNIYLLIIIFIAIFFRVYRIGQNYYFTGELGKELLYIRQFVLADSFPVVGMATSHEWLSYGPIYYWLMMPIFNIFNGNPFILFWTGLIVSVLGLVLNYFLFKKIAGQKIALLSTLIQSVSPLLIWTVRLSKLHIFFFVLIPIFIYLLHLIWDGKKRWIMMAGLVFGIMFSFHFSQIPLLGVVVLLFWIKRKIYKISDWVKFGIGVLIPNITLILRDKDLALWLPYRVINLENKNPSDTLLLVSEYFGKNILWDQSYWFIGFIVFIAIFFHYIYSNYQKIKTDFLPFILISFISLMVVANILHGSPPIHYFLPIFTIVPVLLAIYLAKLKFWPVVIAIILFANYCSFSKDPIFYKSFTGTVKGTDMVNYLTQDKAVSFILSDAKGKEFSIKRVGPFDYFPEQYSQNYKYLAVWKGGKLVEGSNNIYTINDVNNTISK